MTSEQKICRTNIATFQSTCLTVVVQRRMSWRRNMLTEKGKRTEGETELKK